MNTILCSTSRWVSIASLFAGEGHRPYQPSVYIMFTYLLYFDLGNIPSYTCYQKTWTQLVAPWSLPKHNKYHAFINDAFSKTVNTILCSTSRWVSIASLFAGEGHRPYQPSVYMMFTYLLYSDLSNIPSYTCYPKNMNPTRCSVKPSKTQ